MFKVNELKLQWVSIQKLLVKYVQYILLRIFKKIIIINQSNYFQFNSSNNNLRHKPLSLYQAFSTDHLFKQVGFSEMLSVYESGMKIIATGGG